MPREVMGVEIPESHRIEDPLARAAKAYSSLDVRLTVIESDMRDVKQLLQSIKAIGSHIVGKGILLILGGMGGVYGVQKATTPPPVAEKQVIVKSATTIRLEACQGMSVGEDRDECFRRLIYDTTPLPPR